MKDKKLLENGAEQKQYSLNDDRRVKVLSPGMLVFKRFIRNRLAVTGMIILIFMFLFSFLGGIISPYKEDQMFYRMDIQKKDYAAVTFNTEFRYTIADADKFPALAQADTILAIKNGTEKYEYKGLHYTLVKVNDDYYKIMIGNDVIALAHRYLINDAEAIVSDYSFDYTYAALDAFHSGAGSFKDGDKTMTIDGDGIVYGADGKEVAYISRYIAKAAMPDVFLSREFKNELINHIESLPVGSKSSELSYKTTGEDGSETEITYFFELDAIKNQWLVKQNTATRIYDTYSGPSWEHPLGTDGHGMDMLTRLMYGGRVSLIIGFIVVIIETSIGMVLGGISGYFGGWVDNLLMRIVDIFYCIPSTPLLITLGAAMDAMHVDPMIRMLFLMLLLGFFGWPGVARLVRGQILSLREQEFMTATEACGLSVRRRIFKHLLPNVIPQIIVTATMGLGSTILIEATLSFLGLGVRFPFASWGNIINDVNDTHVLTNYWFVWIPAGVLLLATVLAFNIVGDGLRDAFDPKMKR